nr:hypothetical protein [uncultured bacterium]
MRGEWTSVRKSRGGAVDRHIPVVYSSRCKTEKHETHRNKHMLIATTYWHEEHYTIAIEDDEGELDSYRCACLEFNYGCGHHRIGTGDMDPILDDTGMLDFISDMGYRMVGAPVLDELGEVVVDVEPK